ncbi:redoxin domain-containing protein [Lentibacillus sediminis]|uniref:redoxin domain-containing protein n=1 Tax=Lentibacillus sediminis TaxID=1940529 RepID=UPI000C1B8BC2|nr:redoxin domain-containing protein [Lentibacillus sediminis]
MRIKTPLPELGHTTKWLNSRPLSTKDLLNNKPVLVHFWSISCDLCERAIRQINQLRDDYGDAITILSVHMPRSEKDKDTGQIKKKARDHGITQPIAVDNDEEMTKAFRNRYVPAYYLFDASGRLRHYHSGSGGVNMLEKRIKRLLVN